MNLTTLLNGNTNTAGTAKSDAQLAGTGGGTATTSSTASQPLGAVQKRIQADVDSTKTQLSAFGVLKSAVSQSQLAAQALGNLSPTSSEADTTKAMADFVNSYNAVVSASKAASAGASNSADRVRKDFQWSLTGTASSDALKKLGLAVQSDGTLVQDTPKSVHAIKTDAAGVRSALGRLGSAVHTVATRELDRSGTLGDALGRLNQRSTALAAQQKALSSVAQSLAAYQANS